MRTATTLAILVLTASGLPATVQAQAADARVPTIDDVMRLRILVGMEPSPVRDEVVIQVQEYDGGARFAKDLWLAVPGREPRRLTGGGRTGGSFTHSPDGALLAFAGERGGKTGIHVLPLGEGGEARLLLETPAPVDALRWVGDSLYFVASVLPECGADLACTASRLAARAEGPSAMIYTKLYHRPWNAWADGTKQALFRVPAAGGKPGILAGGQADLDVPPLPFGGREDYDVAADGTVVYTAKAVPDPWKSTNSDLFLLEGGKARRITENPAADRAPQFSPDGTRIAFLAQEKPGFESDRWRLRVWDRSSGTVTDVAASIPDWVAEFAWTPDGRSLVFAVEEQGHQPLYQVEARAGAPAKRLTGRDVNRHLSLSRDGRRAYVTRESMVQPPDLYALDLKGATPRPATRRTDLNRDALAAFRMPRTEEIWWDGAEVAPGKRQKVHGFLMLPASVPAGTRLPLVIVVHGGPQGAWMNTFHPRWNPMALAGQGFAVAMPNPTGSVGYGQPFVDAVSRDWGGKPYDDLMALLDHLSQRPDIDGARACAIGGSYGGYMANWMEAKSGNRFRCLVSHAGPSFLEVKYGTTDELWFPGWDIGGTPWDDPENYRKFSPSSYVKDFRTPMLVIQGANDFRVPLEQALFMFTALQERGVESKLVVFPDEDHFILKPRNRKLWYDTVTGWLKDHLK